jgi:hypothetical protein
VGVKRKKLLVVVVDQEEFKWKGIVEEAFAGVKLLPGT